MNPVPQHSLEMTSVAVVKPQKSSKQINHFVYNLKIKCIPITGTNLSNMAISWPKPF